MGRGDFDGMGLERVEEEIAVEVGDKEPKPKGRPKLNPYAEDVKLTTKIPKDIHQRLRLASVYEGKPMVEIVVDLLDEHLPKLKDM